MINLIYTPQRSDLKAVYNTNDDILTVSINDIAETFDFTNLPEGVTKETTIEILPVNPIVAVNKIAETVNITVIRFYGEDEKDIFETTAQ